MSTISDPLLDREAEADEPIVDSSPLKTKENLTVSHIFKLTKFELK